MHFADILLALGVITSRTLCGSSPMVQLDNATFIGLSSGQVSSFLGIPFAQPPTSDLRFRLPVPIVSYSTSDGKAATSYGPSCPQQPIKLSFELDPDIVDYVKKSIFKDVHPASEDCLTINVVTPSNTTPHSQLPVALWIFGGAFELGGTSTYNGGVIVKKSIDLNEPIVYVSMNYRVSGWGFLAGQEVKDAKVGNLGLHDQREAMRWVQKYIRQFGGDPSKVTIWGESAGAISAALHMVANNGDNEGLFRAAFMQSGSPIPVADITRGQKYFDDIVLRTGCSNNSDKLHCLRNVSYDSLNSAIIASPGIFAYQSLLLAWLPRPDGVFLTDNPQVLVAQGKVANVPIINGDVDDEGSLFSISTLNVTSSDALHEYLQTIWLPGAPSEDIDQLLTLYPEDITQGSPYDTGFFNALTNQSKRIGSFEGDAVFQGPRRYFLKALSGKQDIWSYVSKRLKALPVFGSAHATDLANVYGGDDMTDYLVRFVANLDPNGNTGINWPKWTTESPNMMTFLDGPIRQAITQETYRQEPMAYLINLTLANPI